MRFLFFSFLLVMLSGAVLFCQEKQIDSVETVPPASGSINNLEFNMPSFSLYRSLYFEESASEIDHNSVWLWTSFSISGGRSSSEFFNVKTQPHMLANFHDMYVESSKFSMIKTILAAAQAGAVGYLAYKSIQKHGFWDNK